LGEEMVEAFLAFPNFPIYTKIRAVTVKMLCRIKRVWDG